MTFFFNLDKREKECCTRVLNQASLSLPLCLLLLLLSKEVKLELALISAFPNEPFSFGRTRAPSPLPLEPISVGPLKLLCLVICLPQLIFLSEETAKAESVVTRPLALSPSSPYEALVSLFKT